MIKPKSKIHLFIFTTLIILSLLILCLCFCFLKRGNINTDAVVSIISGINVENSSIVDNVTVGSGFFYKPGYIITAGHNAMNTCYAVTYDGDIHETEIVYLDNTFDIAILKIGSENYPTLKITTETININDKVFCVCTPKTIFLKGTILTGLVTNLNINGLSNQYLLQTDLPLSPGCSGSPIINSKGEVIGMNAFKSTEFATESLSFAIISQKLINAIESFENNKMPLNYGITLTENFNNQYGIFLESCIVIEEISDNSIFNSVLQEKDMIIYVDDVEIFTKADFFENINEKSNLIINRNDEQIKIALSGD